MWVCAYGTVIIPTQFVVPPSVYSQKGNTSVQYFGVYILSVNKRTSWYSKPLFSSMANFEPSSTNIPLFTS